MKLHKRAIKYAIKKRIPGVSWTCSPIVNEALIVGYKDGATWALSQRPTREQIEDLEHTRAEASLQVRNGYSMDYVEGWDAAIRAVLELMKGEE